MVAFSAFRDIQKGNRRERKGNGKGAGSIAYGVPDILALVVYTQSTFTLLNLHSEIDA